MINTIVFDLGGVLIDWNPRYLYNKLFDDENKVKDFLDTICTSDWNEEQDAGRSLQEGTELLVSQFPEQADNIRAYYGRWEEMLEGGAIEGTVDLFKQLKESGRYKFYALTNWSEETFPIALNRYNFFNWFDGIIVSGTEKMRKPAEAFYKLLLERYNLQPETTLFVDDNVRNTDAAALLGFQTISFTSADTLGEELAKKGLL